MTRDEIKDSAAIVWANYRTEGWQPSPFASIDSALEAVQSGNFYGEIIITTPLRMTSPKPASNAMRDALEAMYRMHVRESGHHDGECANCFVAKAVLEESK